MEKALHRSVHDQAPGLEIENARGQALDLAQVVAGGDAGFDPYVRHNPDRPAPANHLLERKDWSAFYFWRDGAVVANGDDANVLGLVQNVTWAPVVRVGTGAANDAVIADFRESPTGSSFTLLWKGQEWGRVKWALPGLFNARNAAMAYLAGVGETTGLLVAEVGRRAPASKTGVSGSSRSSSSSTILLIDNFSSGRWPVSSGFTASGWTTKLP